MPIAGRFRQIAASSEGSRIRSSRTNDFVYTLRCTRKLLGRAPNEPAAQDVAPTTLLGDWYANVLVRRPHHLVLAVSERTLLPVIVPAKDAAKLPERVADAALGMLLAVGVTKEQAEAERAEMTIARFGRTASRRVLGSLNEFMFDLEFRLRARPDESLLDMALMLAQMPCKLLEHSSPDRATLALFATSIALERVLTRTIG